MRIFNLISADWHAGHINGVLAPGTKLLYDDPGEPVKEFTPTLTGGQDRIFNITQNVFSYIETVGVDIPVCVIQVGDVVNGNNYTETLVSSRMAHQIAIARGYLDEFHNRLNMAGFYTVHGTDVHVFGEGSAEELIAEYAREKYHIESISASHMLLNIGGVRFDISHEGPNAGEAWLAGNAARGYLRRRMMEDMDCLGREPADVYVRAHVHGFADVYDTIERNKHFYHSRLVICPAMCIPNSYARRVTRSINYYRLGMLLAEVVDGRLIGITPLLQTYDVRNYITAGVVASPYQGSPRPGVSRKMKEMWTKKKQ